MVRQLAGVFFVLVSAQLGFSQEHQPGPDSQVQEGVPKGKVTKQHWVSKIFEGTERDFWVYVPSQYDGNKPACVMVFQDGGGYVSEKGQSRVPVVFDNLIAKKEMPVTIGIFINPGTKPAKEAGGKGVSNRSFEYDTLGDQYARFLLEETIRKAGDSAAPAPVGFARSRSPGSGRTSFAKSSAMSAASQASHIAPTSPAAAAAIFTRR